MATLLPHRPPSLVLTPSSDRTHNPILCPTRHCFGFSDHHKPFLRGSLAVARLGFRPGLFPDSENAQGVIQELFGRAESFLYTLADAAVSASSSSSPAETVTTAKQSDDWLSGITNYLEAVLKVLKDGLSAVHVSYSHGFAIILLTVLVKAATFPLTKKQVESAMAMRSLQPQVKAIQQRYAGNQEKIQLETARLYKLAGINPLAGCLPTLATIPVWIGLYRALSNVADEGLLTEGFFWIPSLAGPTTIAARQNGSGISWLFPFIDGHPPLGWSDTFAYLVLPVLLIVTQYISVQIMQPSQSDDPNMKNSQVLTKVLPLMIGYFALSVPSGLSLYWLTNNILSTAQQVWLQKLGGAKNPVNQFGNTIINEDQPQVSKTIAELGLAQKDAKQQEEKTQTGLQPGERFKQIKEQEAKQEEEKTPTGLRPGERFKQIKEQEARRRKEKEEAKGRTEEAAAKGSQETNGRHEIENRDGVELGVEKSKEHQSENAVQHSSNGIPANVDLPRQETKEDKNNLSIFQTADGEVSTHSEVKGDAHKSYDNVEKEAVEVYSTSTTRDRLSGEDTDESKRE